MSLALVVKLGGDALASPERIAAEAGRIARLAAAGPVVAVASARRGVTDRLLGLAEEVDSAARRLGDSAAPQRPGGCTERDRVVASGEVVAASLLALALNRLGVRAVSLDAREAGIAAAGRFGGARIQRVNPRRIAQLLARGVVPVVTGFQGWRRGRVATLHRGGTDASAIAVAAALGSSRVLFVKDAEGLRTADPKLVPESRPIRHAPHHFLTALTAAG
ncbi:MAG: aspartate kinase, partial [Gemmatimonadota bacterium]|nr:aspartate kinase [Gemmatimonadota bacterium]